VPIDQKIVSILLNSRADALFARIDSVKSRMLKAVSNFHRQRHADRFLDRGVDGAFVGQRLNKIRLCNDKLSRLSPLRRRTIFSRPSLRIALPCLSSVDAVDLQMHLSAPIQQTFS